MTPTTTLAELAVTHPGAAPVFARHRLDFCCNGRRSLATACAERGLDADAILAAIQTEDREQPVGVAWEREPLPALIEHIVTTYHAALRRDLPDLIAMAARVEARHGDKPECPRGLTAQLEAMHEAVLEHLAKEEQILFPMILAGHGARAAGPVHVMELEHDHHGENLRRVRAMTTDLDPPEVACTTWRALYLGLARLERELFDHIHLENNVLFRRALGA